MMPMVQEMLEISLEKVNSQEMTTTSEKTPSKRFQEEIITMVLINQEILKCTSLKTTAGKLHRNDHNWQESSCAYSYNIRYSTNLKMILLYLNFDIKYLIIDY